MDCSQINEDMLDEYIMGRPTPAGLTEHLASCQHCAAQFFEYRNWVEALRLALSYGAFD
jgi:anti-sigma factor RsiW